MNENITNATTSVSDEPKNDIGEILNQVVRKGSNKELALIADNADSSAEVLLVRGDAGEPETYWFHIDGRVMSSKLKDLLCQTLHLDEEALTEDAGLYAYMATAAGIAACFQSNIPGVALREAFFCPLDAPLYAFVNATRGWNAHEVVFIKRNRNLAYKYRKACEDVRSRIAAPSSDVTGISSSEAYANDAALADFDDFFGVEENKGDVGQLDSLI